MREKKWLALGLTAVMTAGMLSACGKEAAQETAETKKEEADGNAAAEEGSAAKEKPYDGTELTFWLQPSTRALSSISLGMAASKYPLIIRVQKGTAQTV